MNRRFKKPGTHVDHSQRPNLIKHQPNARIQRADITYLELRPGTWVYLSSIYEPKVHQVLAFKIGRQMKATLVVETINQALECHQKPQYFHSDMGSQYTSNEVETLLERHQISHSYSKQGYPYDNGPIEAFHSLLKREFAFQTTFSNFEDLVIRTSNYISWFNSDRIRTSVQKKMCHLLTQEHHASYSQVAAKFGYVERSFSWIEKCRRLWKNCERQLHTSATMMTLAFMSVLLRRF